MKRTIVAVFVFSIAACSSSSSPPAASSTAPSPTGQSSSTSPTESPDDASPDDDGSPSIGDSITLKSNDGSKIAVTLLQLIDPGTPAENAAPLDSEDRFVAVEISMMVVSGTYDDSPTNGAGMVDSDNHAYDSDLFGEVTEAQPFPTTLTFGEGETRQGTIVFDLPPGTTPVTFQFTLNSGFGPDTGEWGLAA